MHSRPPDQRWTNQNGIFKIDKSNGSETGTISLLPPSIRVEFELVFDFKLRKGRRKYSVERTVAIPVAKSGICLERARSRCTAIRIARWRQTGAVGCLCGPVLRQASWPSFNTMVGEWKLQRDGAGRVPDRWVRHSGSMDLGSVRVPAIMHSKPWSHEVKYAQLAAGILVLPSGYIPLQDHGDAVESQNGQDGRELSNR